MSLIRLCCTIYIYMMYVCVYTLYITYSNKSWVYVYTYTMHIYTMCVYIVYIWMLCAYVCMCSMCACVWGVCVYKSILADWRDSLGDWRICRVVRGPGVKELQAASRSWEWSPADSQQKKKILVHQVHGDEFCPNPPTWGSLVGDLSPPESRIALQSGETSDKLCLEPWPIGTMR